MTKICAISDQHGHIDFQIPSCDLLIIAGDICPAHDHSSVFQKYWLHNDFYHWLEKQDYQKCVFISGNHDFLEEQQPGSIRRDKFRRIRAYYLQDEWIELFGLKIYGTPFSVQFYDWAFMEEEDELAKIYRKIPDKLDVLISHGPPKSYGDLTIEGINAGSLALTERLKQINCGYVITGHIHEGRGRYLFHQNQLLPLVYNCSLLDEKYNMVNEPFIIDI